jgi:hypothetical protein
MAKKDKKKSKKDTKPTDAVGAVRTAVERTFQATADSALSTRTRAQDLVDEVAGAAGRVREMLDDINVLEDLKRLRTEVETLRTRVAALEEGPAKPATRSRSAASSARKRTTPTAKAAGTARSTAKKRSAASSRTTAAKPRATARKKPASSS